MHVLKLWFAVILGAAQLTPGGSISGTVRFSRGEPVAGVRVMAMMVPRPGRGGGQSVLVSLTESDKDGHYHLDDIPNGQYFIAAGPVDSPVFYPGTGARTDARVVAITADARALSGIDISIATGGRGQSSPPATSSQVLCCDLSGLVLTEDGGPMPAGPLRVADMAHTWSVDTKDGFFRVSIPRGTVTQFSVEGLPPGYALRSVVYGGRNAGLASVMIDGRQPQAVLLRISVLPGSTLPNVSVRGKIVNVAPELNFRSMSMAMSSSVSGGPSFTAPIESDNSFAFPNITIGTYQPGLRDATGKFWGISSPTEVRNDAKDLTIDLRNNPFPELDSPQPLQSLFTGGKELEISGVATQRLTHMRASGRTVYFRMDVRDAQSGAITAWAIYIHDEGLVPNIEIGQTYTLKGTVASDGTHRLNAQPF